MKIQHVSALVGAAALSLSLASSAAALSVNVGTGVDVQANVGGTASAHASTSAAAAVSSNDAAASNNTDASVSANLTPLYVTQADVSAGMVSPTADNATSVQSGSDLSGYAAARLQDDSDISQIQTSGSNVAVTYKLSAKVLGIFPADVPATATVASDGSVDISYPWYAFLFSTADTSQLKAQIQARAAVDLGAHASAGLSAQQQAKLIGDISSVMHSAANASAAGDANAQ